MTYRTYYPGETLEHMTLEQMTLEHMTLELRANAGVAAFYIYVSCIFFLYPE